LDLFWPVIKKTLSLANRPGPYSVSICRQYSPRRPWPPHPPKAMVANVLLRPEIR